MTFRDACVPPMGIVGYTSRSETALSSLLDRILVRILWSRLTANCSVITSPWLLFSLLSIFLSCRYYLSLRVIFVLSFACFLFVSFFATFSFLSFICLSSFLPLLLPRLLFTTPSFLSVSSLYCILDYSVF